MGKLSSITIVPLGGSGKGEDKKPAGDEHEYSGDEDSGDDCRTAFDDVAEAIDIPEDKRDAAYEAFKSFIELVSMKADKD